MSEHQRISGNQPQLEGESTEGSELTARGLQTHPTWAAFDRLFADTDAAQVAFENFRAMHPDTDPDHLDELLGQVRQNQTVWNPSSSEDQWGYLPRDQRS